jgi:hypothetical protein
VEEEKLAQVQVLDLAYELAVLFGSAVGTGFE